ncbi:circadian clock protein KaiA [Crocosphaera watsonii WH 8501]|uniref:circadian clock protein KaiA n=1 Tax=Crocosphaera TaxID=263510 RepID=UPI0005680B25|nr:MULTISPECIES: circadian clock protein KaiA [Crocosphaera]MCH2245346.1 circadian clock protein KaiA [Crocosphaera sp.]NQZ62508.1 circadian clock protein KaiA [Crocosphaera sp.]
MQTRLSICLCSSDKPFTQLLANHLSGDRYRLHIIDQVEELIPFLKAHSETIDCLIVREEASILPLFNQLYERGTLLPVIIVEKGEDPSIALANVESPTFLYHSAEVRHGVSQLGDVQMTIDRAITKFLHLGPSCCLADRSLSAQGDIDTEKHQSFLLLQQRRLAEKLKERLGYLGVYYKRNPQYFYRNLSPEDKQALLKELMTNYREIILNYFGEDADINQAIDQFVNQAFFADISVSRVLELHMELMDEFSQQLKLEGRSEEILLDYRLTIIDILAHLGEMYRRCIPRGDLLFDLLNQMD